MSYARFGCDGSDVYVYGSNDGKREFLVCCGCNLGGGAIVSCRTEAEMIAHLLAHREAGHTVPEYTLERLREESALADKRPLAATDDPGHVDQ